jgi:hypothetical protein
MKKRLSIYSAMLMFAIIFWGCSKCNKVICPSEPGDNIRFSILNKNNNTNLVFGPSAIYDKNKIRFYYLAGADTINISYQPAAFSGSNTDSVLFVLFDKTLTTDAYCKLSNSDVDTLQVSFKTEEQDCCGPVTSLTSIRYNNTILDAGASTKTIYK